MEDLAGGEIVELTKTRMHTLWVLVADLLVFVGLVHSLWLAVEDDLLEFGGVDLSAFFFRGFGGIQLVVEQTLASVQDAAIVSVFYEDFNEPPDYWEQGLVVQTLNLVGEDDVRALHCAK